MLPHLVVFDFDGTLADTRNGVSQTMNHVLREAGLPRVDPSFIWGLMGLPLATLIARLIPPTYDASVDALVHAYREAFPTHGEPVIRAFPEVDAVLDELAKDGFVLAVATSRARYSVQRLLDQLDLSSPICHGGCWRRPGARKACTRPTPLGIVDPRGPTITGAHGGRHDLRPRHGPCSRRLCGRGGAGIPRRDAPFSARLRRPCSRTSTSFRRRHGNTVQHMPDNPGRLGSTCPPGASMDLGTRLAKPGTTLADLEAWFDDMDHAGRMDAIKTSSRAHQRMLWHKAAGATPLTLDDMVPSSVPDVTEVIHHGRNSLPLPSAFKFFQKRMARPSEGDDVLFGYNEGKTRPWIGPGYFVLRQTEGNAQWMPRGVHWSLTTSASRTAGCPPTGHAWFQTARAFRCLSTMAPETSYGASAPMSSSVQPTKGRPPSVNTLCWSGKIARRPLPPHHVTSFLEHQQEVACPATHVR